MPPIKPKIISIVAKVKIHLRNNKKIYIVGGSCLIAGAAGGAFCTRGGVQIVDAFNIFKWKSPHTSMTVLIRRGHPGYIIKCQETGELFASQSRAASANGIDQAGLSRHLNGVNPHAGGLHFERLGEAKAIA